MHDTFSRLSRIPIYRRLFALALFLGLIVGFRHLAPVSYTHLAGGGGDTPEHVAKALHEAVYRSNWSASKNSLKLVYLVGDAPPHLSLIHI